MWTDAQLYDAFSGPPDAAADFLAFIAPRGGLLIDVGCGTGSLFKGFKGFKGFKVPVQGSRCQVDRVTISGQGATVRVPG